MLTAIRECGSLKAAAENLGMSYRGLWARIRHSERRLGFALLCSKPGRGADAGSTLTPEAVQLLKGFEKLERGVHTASERSYSKHLENLM
ncbi:MAG: LysR family transcriptional regulator [Candidatus Eisenbacteria bacterium]